MGNGMHFQESHFIIDVSVTKIDSNECHEELKTWDDDDQYHLCQEALHWMGSQGSEIEKLFFKDEHISIQREIKLHRSRGKESVIKETKT